MATSFIEKITDVAEYFMSGAITSGNTLTKSIATSGIYLVVTFHPSTVNTIGLYICGSSASEAKVEAILSASSVSVTCTVGQLKIKNNSATGLRYGIFHFV